MLGYWLGEEHHGCGLMREAAQAVVATAFSVMQLDVVEAAAQPGNFASFAVLRHCGMHEVGQRMIYAPSRDREELCIVYEAHRNPSSVVS
jgi:ribosomal-protein-alanine N-acetyltransferase